MIIFAIKICLFSRVNSYSLGQKLHIWYIFSLFCEEIIRITYAILVIAIKDLKLYCRNKNLPIEKNAIWFESYSQKYKTNKYFKFFNRILTLIIIFRDIYLTWKDIDQYIFFMSRSYFINPQETSLQISNWERGGEIRDKLTIL